MIKMNSGVQYDNLISNTHPQPVFRGFFLATKWKTSLSILSFLNLLRPTTFCSFLSE